MASGLSAKLYLGESSAVQAAVGINGWGISMGADYVQSLGNLMDDDSGKLFWGVGGGASLVLYDVGIVSSTVIGFNAVVELGYHFKSFPLEIVIDYRPTFFLGDVIGGLDFTGAGGAIRWYF